MIDQTHLSTLLSSNTAGQIIFLRLSELSDGGAEFVRALMLASKRLVQLFGWPVPPGQIGAPSGGRSWRP